MKADEFLRGHPLSDGDRFGSANIAGIQARATPIIAAPSITLINLSLN
jgi:hypothetical protein